MIGEDPSARSAHRQGAVRRAVFTAACGIIFGPDKAPHTGMTV